VNRPRLLLTGGGGFVGTHVVAAGTPGGAFSGWDIVPLPRDCDVRDASALEAVAREVRPDAVLHLAAQSFVPRSFEDPRETFDINLGGTLNLLEALAAADFDGRMLLVSSGDVYGRVPEDELPVDESRLPRPRSPYAVSKIAAEQLCLLWHMTRALDVMVARPFNHVGPGQDPRFVVPALARQVVEIAAGRRPAVIDAGDIDTTRDFTDVRDVVAAYSALLSGGNAGEIYVIGTGREARIRDLLALMCRFSGIDPEIRQDPARMRPSEQRRMAANASKLRKDTGWAPRISIETTLQEILNEARKDNE
jgi:GDP-4-dehydro-6-deoxy-D-mannose reductase